MFKNTDIKSLLDLSKETALMALEKLKQLDKESIKQYSYDENIEREVKALADIIIEKIILDKLLPTGINILSEEAGLIEGDQNSRLKFIIDPIDGTVNFVRGVAECSICIALFEEEKPIFGVIASYPSNEIAWGGKQLGSFLGSSKLEVSNIGESEKGLLCTGFPSRFKFEKKSLSSQIRLMSKFGKTRMLGSASQSLLKVAKGSAECYSEHKIMIWDVAAGIPIVEGAGGRIKINNISKEDDSLDVTADNGYINLK